MLLVMASIATNIFMKWSKVLMVIILMEGLSVTIMSIILVNSTSLYFLVMFMFLFFVGEALIILSSFYSAVRHSGLIQGGVLLW